MARKNFFEFLSHRIHHLISQRTFSSCCGFATYRQLQLPSDCPQTAFFLMVDLMKGPEKMIAESTVVESPTNNGHKLFLPACKEVLIWSMLNKDPGQLN